VEIKYPEMKHTFPKNLPASDEITSKYIAAARQELNSKVTSESTRLKDRDDYNGISQKYRDQLVSVCPCAEYTINRIDTFFLQYANDRKTSNNTASNARNFSSAAHYTAGASKKTRYEMFWPLPAKVEPQEHLILENEIFCPEKNVLPPCVVQGGKKIYKNASSASVALSDTPRVY
jgi:hypothetical protein